jgi:DNA invertase Pin-like site-specific DNA recombinase
MQEKTRVAVYARVSTEHEEQIEALGNQMQYYRDIIAGNLSWEINEMYVDEGLTGTSTKKRPSFNRMIQDAKENKFDMIITREVSRFARNTVDTLHFTRELKKHGIPVLFTMDNINTFDKDGELRLTIMASLAQEESRKTSERVKSGMQKSMEKGVVYGTGNIIGYTRKEGKLIVDEEQSKIVKLIYKMYLEGSGTRIIQFELERLGFKNSLDKVKWHPTTIVRILQNPFYCGRVVYKKEVVVDFLEQKRAKNNGIVDKIYRNGTHEPLVSEEDFDNVQKIMSERVQQLNCGAKGKKKNQYFWSGKLFCGECGSTYKRCNWHKLKDGTRIYAYWCSKRAINGKSTNRLAYNSPTENTCDSVAIPEWKFDTMAKYVIQKIWENKEETLQKLETAIRACSVHVDFTDEIIDIKRNIDKYSTKISRLIDMRSDDEITKEEFASRRKEYDEYIAIQNELLKKYEEKAIETANVEIRIDNLKNFFSRSLNFETDKLDDEVVELLINRVVIEDKKTFKFYLNTEISMEVNAEDVPQLCTPPHKLLSTNWGTWDKSDEIFYARYSMGYTDICHSTIIGKPLLKNQWWDDVKIEVYFI